MFNFLNLDDKTRALMVEAIDEARSGGQMVYSPRLNDAGLQQWGDLLREAAQSHDEHWLAYELEEKDLVKGLEVSRRKLGGYSVKHVPNSAAQQIAENQFNRFYMLALCMRARAEGIPVLEVYRAAERSAPRPESEALVGSHIAVRDMEAELRDAQASNESPLLQPNSGLSLKIPTEAFSEKEAP